MPPHAVPVAQTGSLLMVAGEASGDQHGAALVRALRTCVPQVQVYGLGGHNMRAAGVETLFDIKALNVVGLLEASTKIPQGLAMARQLLAEAKKRGTRVVVLIDAPGFNLPFARRAKRAGMRVVYYVSPQIWAWRPQRVRHIARCVDKMLTLFPFEVPFYTAAGVDAACVGHPLLDRLPQLPAPEAAAGILGLDAQRPIVALLPGSRSHEVQRLLPPMLAALRIVRQHLPLVQGVLPLAPSLPAHVAKRFLDSLPGGIRVVHGQSLLALRAATCAMVASGTATLEAGLLGIPMVVVYRVHPLTALVARLLVRVPHISLVNIIAGRRLVPELVQGQVRAQTMAALMVQYLTRPVETALLRQELLSLRAALGPSGGVQRAAAWVQTFLGMEREAPISFTTAKER